MSITTRNILVALTFHARWVLDFVFDRLSAIAQVNRINRLQFSIQIIFDSKRYLLKKAIFRNNNTDFIKDFGLNQRFNFPSRFHSSLTFGVGINF
jgi:hypothetical protein